MVTTQSSSWPQRVCRLLSRGAGGGWGVLGKVHSLFDLHAVITFTNPHTQSWMNKHACPHHTTLCKVHCKRLTYKEQECYIFIINLINTECPRLFWEYWLLSKKGWSGQLINDPTESLGFRWKDTVTLKPQTGQTCKVWTQLARP